MLLSFGEVPSRLGLCCAYMGALSLSAPFVHRFDPILFEIGPVRLWYYGLAYALGFLGIHLWLRWRRRDLGWSLEEVYDFSLVTTVSCLLVAHFFEIFVYEWDLYRENLLEILKYWHGGMATHGVLLGGIVGIAIFSRLRHKDWLDVADTVVIPTAFFMGLGRLGNFINGENYGPITDRWWAVQFPYADGFRHPVDLYDGFKNFLVVVILLLVRRSAPPRGALLAHFFIWYGLLRFAIDFFRDYGSELLGLARGQYFNFGMGLVGVSFLWWSFRQPVPGASQERPRPVGHRRQSLLKPTVFSCLLLFCLTIPSGWSQQWLERLRNRQALASLLWVGRPVPGSGRPQPFEQNRRSTRYFLPSSAAG